MAASPRSKEFDDIYFSEADGLAETHHVFLKGNGLPERWENRAVFAIGETGFGTGLNFLAVWKLFRETKELDAKLNYISFEKFPLPADQIKDFLEPWQDEFGYELDTLCKTYPPLTPGVHNIAIDEHTALTLIFGDVNETMPKFEGKVDCWFLDGFKPATNPEMWTETVFKNMARLSNPGATFATFTAAGSVKRGLTDAGFTVEKCDGFRWKRDMLKGHL